MKKLLIGISTFLCIGSANASKLISVQANEAGGGGSVIGNQLLDIVESKRIRKLDLTNEPEYDKYLRPLIEEMSDVYAYLGRDLDRVLANMTWYFVSNPKFNHELCSAKNSITDIKGKIVACQLNGAVLVDWEWHTRHSTNDKNKKLRSDVYFHEIMLNLSFGRWMGIGKEMYSDPTPISPDIVRYVVATFLNNKGNLKNAKLDTDFMGTEFYFYPKKVKLDAMREPLRQTILETLNSQLLAPTKNLSNEQKFLKKLSLCVRNKPRDLQFTEQQELLFSVEQGSYLSNTEIYIFSYYLDEMPSVIKKMNEYKTSCPQSAQEYYDLVFSGEEPIDSILEDLFYSGALFPKGSVL